jgi:hypothetical protein
MTFPITTVWTSEPFSFDRANAVRTTVAPSSVAGTALRLPSKVLIAVRTASHRTISR